MRKTTQIWADGVEVDVKIMGVRNWYRVAGDKGGMEGVVLEAKIHSGV